MKIAEIAPVLESVPPRLYGGTERVVSYLTEELVRLGHDVTLFASGDSVTGAKLVPLTERALWHDPQIANTWPHQVMAFDEVLRRADEFDVLHFHTELLQFPMLGPELRRRSVTTLHYRLDDRDLVRFFDGYEDAHLVTISDSHRLPLGSRPRVTTIHHGLPADLLPFEPQPTGDYLVFVGRISPDKGVHRAIEISARAGMTLRIAAKVDAADRAFWEEVVKPMLNDNPNVEFLGQIDDDDKACLLGNATAMLFPIDWPEPFGLAMIEAMACGTPVITRPCGAAPEIVEDGVSGWLFDTTEDALEAIGRIDRLDRGEVRRAFERRFTAARMAADYVRLFERVSAEAAAPHAQRGAR